MVKLMGFFFWTDGHTDRQKVRVIPISFILHLITQLLQSVGWLDLVNQYNHTSWVAVVPPTNHAKFVHNHCVIEVFGGVFCVVTLLCGLSCWYERFL